MYDSWLNNIQRRCCCVPWHDNVTTIQQPPMKILQLGKFYPVLGGVEKVMFDITKGLSEEGVECDMMRPATEEGRKWLSWTVAGGSSAAWHGRRRRVPPSRRQWFLSCGEGWRTTTSYIFITLILWRRWRCCSVPDVLARWSARIKSKGRTREGKERKEKKKRTARKRNKKRLGRVLVCVRVLHLIYNR